MGVIRFGILCLLFGFLGICVNANPVEESSKSLRAFPYIAIKSDGSTVCDENEMFKWTYGFHDCFVTRKYADGGRDLKSIVDRILDHEEACIERSSIECRPDFQGFITLMKKAISQMKDYAQMYLEEIYKGRENIKDLECVEAVLNINTYEDCFKDIVPQAYALDEDNLQKVVQEGIFCANRVNSGCSKEAKTSLNRIVRIILGVEQPNEEEFEVAIQTTEAPTTKVEEPIEKEFEDEIKPFKLPATQFEEPNQWKFEDEIKPTEAPAPWMWYDYLAYPFVQAWKWVSSLFR